MNELKIIKKITFLLTTKARYKVLYGGRGSGKSWGIADFLILLSLQKKLRILCTRQYQSSISMSVHKLLSDSIYKLGLAGHFEITKDSIRCKRTKSEFFFKGLQKDVGEIKSIEGIDICWVEEAQNVSKESWEVLCPTIRKEGSEIWISFNPKLIDDETYQRFVVHPQPDCISVQVNYTDNPWFPDVLKKEMEYCRRTSPTDYEYIWLGKPQINTDAQVFHNRYIVDDFPEAPEDTRFFHGADWGFAKDPTVLMRCFIKDNRLYIDREAYGVGVELDDTPSLFREIETATRFPIKADCARPETISYMKRRGFNITPAKKWQGSVEDGLAVLKSFEKIVIHPRCKHAADEFRLYSYKVDKNNGDILPILEDKNNHCLVPGTMILTRQGEKPIEEVTTEDEVLTRKGWKRVLWSGVSDKNRKVYKVTTCKGNFIVGTENHKVLTSKGFLRIDALRYNDELLIERNKCQSYCSLMEKSGEDIHNQKEEAIENILNAEANTCTIMSGKCLSAQEKLALLYTILTGIAKITISQIWKRLRRNSIWNVIRFLKNAKNWQKKGLKKGLSTNIGTKQKKELNGTKNTQKNRISAFSICRKFFVRTAEESLSPKRITINFAQTHANQHIEENLALMTLLSVANGADTNLQQINTVKQDFVVGRVLTVEAVGIAPKVYDLTVDDCHEFFANGILVHNCIDSLRYALDGYIKGRGTMNINPDWEQYF